MPLIAFLALTHLRIPRLLSVLGGGRCSNQGSIHSGATREPHSIGLKQLPDLSKELCANLASFQQVAEIEQGRRIGYSFTPEVNPAEVAECGDVIQGIFTRLISQVEPIGDQVHSKHPFQAHRRVARFDQRAERSTRNKHFHRRQKHSLARRAAVNLKSFDCCQRHFPHRFSAYSQNYLSDHMTNESFITYLAFF